MPVVPFVKPTDSKNTNFPFADTPWSSLGPVLKELNWGGPTIWVIPLVVLRSQQFGHVPVWLKAGIVHEKLSKLSLHGAETATQPVVNCTGPTQLLNDVGPQESLTHAS